MVISDSFVKALHLFVYETTRYISPFAIATEWVIVAVAAAIIFLAPRYFAAATEDLHKAFRWFAARKHLSVLACGFFPVGVRLMMIRFAGFPKPSIHDEFSHLLLADTLSSGRLANPSHPMWRHLESIHIIQQPTYSSMYLPGQALFLAFGQSVFHHPWFGVLIAVGLMCMSVCWMLQGYLPASWALYATLLMDLKIGIVGFWMNSYMGGEVGAIGGALVVGSLPRISTKVTRSSVIALALGLLLLLNSRPFEGGILTIAVLVIMALRLRPKSVIAWRPMLANALPAVALFIVGVVFTSYYCFRVTGSPFRLPYEVNRAAYGWPENLAILPPKKIHLEHAVMQAMYEKEVGNRQHYASPALVIDSLDTRFFDCWIFFVGPVLTVPMLLVPWSLRNRDHIVLLGLIGLEAVVNLFQLLLYPQHLAHLTGVIFALLGLGVWFLYQRIASFSLVRAHYMALVIPAGLVLVGLMKLFWQPLQIPVSYWERAYEIHRDARFAIEQSMEQLPGKQLVIVQYGSDHSPDQEWVYNRADIDNSKVVWARDMGSGANQELLNYFRNRSFWLLRVDELPLVPIAYTQAADKSQKISALTKHAIK